MLNENTISNSTISIGMVVSGPYVNCLFAGPGYAALEMCVDINIITYNYFLFVGVFALNNIFKSDLKYLF